MKLIATIISYTVYPFLEFLKGIHSNFPICCVWSYIKNGSLNPNKNTISWWQNHIDKYNEHNCGYIPCDRCLEKGKFISKDKIIRCINCTSLYCKLLDKIHLMVVEFLYKNNAIAIPMLDIDNNGKSTLTGLYSKR